MKSIRRWLDHVFFRDDDASRLLRPTRTIAVVAGSAVLLTGLQLLRMSASAPLNSIWAEDGSQWLTRASTHGFVSNLRTPYNGYLQTSSRLLGELVSRLPVSWFAVAMALTGSLVVTGCAFTTWAVSAAHVRSRSLRLALAASVVLVPTAGVEMLDNVTNTIWFMQYVCFWLLLWRPRSLRRAFAAAAMLCLIALSSIGVVFFLPLWLLRLIAARDRRDALILCGLPLGLLVQISPLAKPGAAQPLARWNWDLIPAYGQRVIAAGALGNRLAGAAWTSLGVPLEIVAGVAFLGGAAYALAGARPCARALAGLALGTSVFTFLVSGYARSAGPALFWSSGTHSTLVSRYVIVPSLLVLAAAVVLLDDRRGRAGGVARASALAWLGAIAVVSFPIGDGALRGEPRYEQALAAARARCVGRSGTVSIGVSPPFFFAMHLPCHRLR